MSNFRIEESEKYAIIALPNLRVANSLPPEVHLTPEFWIVRSLPVNLDSHWRQWIGSLQVDALKNASLFLISKGPSKAPDILDEENQKYQMPLGWQPAAHALPAPTAVPGAVNENEAGHDDLPSGFVTTNAQSLSVFRLTPKHPASRPSKSVRLF
jgi:hypothetical protein